MTVRSTAKGIEKQIWDEVATIPDPELHIPLVDMGLVYDITEKKGDVTVTMTLTTIGCPLASTIEKLITEKILPISGVSTVAVNVVFDPPWTIDMMSDEVKMKLGIL